VEKLKVSWFQQHVPTAAVGLITEPEQAEYIIVTDEADAIFLARAMLRYPPWALMASENSVIESIGRCHWIGVGLFRFAAIRQ
jgi:2,4-dienoyl-CoA reductase-like NADH-dependent reductase (Old Yellow Enzyme family)